MELFIERNKNKKIYQLILGIFTVNKYVAPECGQACQNPADSAGGNDLLFTRRSKGALRFDKNEEKAKRVRFYQPTLPESLQQNRAG